MLRNQFGESYNNIEFLWEKSLRNLHSVNCKAEKVEKSLPEDVILEFRGFYYPVARDTVIPN